MLMHNKFQPDSVVSEVKIDLAPALASCLKAESDAEAKRKEVWEIIVRMHYLSHELRDPELELGVSPEFTRFVSAVLSEWAILAEAAAGEAGEPKRARALRSEHH